MDRHDPRFVVSGADGTTGERWLPILWRYLALMAGANVAWELAHLPLYTIWQSPGPRAAVLAALHCAVGDVVLAALALTTALPLVRPLRPRHRLVAASLVATALGVGATIVLERLQTQVWRGWTYADAMPIVPWLEVGLSPLLQWTLLPPVMLAVARRLAA